MRGGAFFNGKEGRDDFRKLSFWLKGDGGNRKSLLFKEQDLCTTYKS
jgi:hypothetical protein